MTPTIDNYSEHLGLPLYSTLYDLSVHRELLHPPPPHPLYPAAVTAIMYLESFVPEFMYEPLYRILLLSDHLSNYMLSTPKSSKYKQFNQEICMVSPEKFSFWYIHHIFVATPAYGLADNLDQS